MFQASDPESELKYNKFYVGLIKDGRANNYVAFRPNKAVVLFEPKLPRTDETDALLEDAGVETLEYAARWNNYRIRISDADLKEHEGLIRMLIEKSRTYREW